jgi:tRNA U34 2-thiouridine synthase MnmA/TrmU
MKHVKLFEAFDIEMTPEEFGEKIDDILQSGGDHLEITKALNDLSSSTQRYHTDKKYTAQLQKLSPWMDSLSDVEKEEVRALNKELKRKNTEREKTPQEIEFEEREAEEKKRKAEEWDQSNIVRRDRDRRSAIIKLLDGYKNGTIDIDQATKEILLLGNPMYGTHAAWHPKS